MRNSLRLVFVAAILLCCVGASHAATIEYGLTNLGGGNFKYDYTYIDWGGLTGAVDLAIYFPDVISLDNFSYSLISGTAPAGWTVSLYAPSAINLGGIADFAGTIGAPALSAPTGFSVTFLYTGQATLGSQFFEIYDSQFNVAGRGFTQLPAGPPGAIPEPSTLLLLGTGVLAILGLRKK